MSQVCKFLKSIAPALVLQLGTIAISAGQLRHYMMSIMWIGLASRHDFSLKDGHITSGLPEGNIWGIGEDADRRWDFVKSERYTAICTPDYSSAELESPPRRSRRLTTVSAICANTGAAAMLPVASGWGSSRTTMIPISGRSAGKTPMNETMF